MSEPTDFRVALLATDGFEESELTEPVKAPEGYISFDAGSIL